MRIRMLLLAVLVALSTGLAAAPRPLLVSSSWLAKHIDDPKLGFQQFYESTARGPLTLPAFLGLPYGVVVAAVVAVALLGFRGAEWLERRS